HADHVPTNRKLSVFATPATAALMRVRGFKGSIIELPFYEPITFGSAKVRLYPAGHILGSAMTYVETPQGTVLYTSDYRYQSSPASYGFDSADQLDYCITDATFSLPLFKWKAQAIVFDEIRDFVKDSRSFQQIPVFLTYTLGQAQQVMM